MNRLLFLLASVSLFFSCKSTPELKSGLWRAEVPTVAGVLPFHILIENNQAFAINADEKLPFDTLYFKNDSLHLKMELFDAEIIAKLEGESMNGVFRKKMPIILFGSSLVHFCFKLMLRPTCDDNFE